MRSANAHQPFQAHLQFQGNRETAIASQNRASVDNFVIRYANNPCSWCATTTPSSEFDFKSTSSCPLKKSSDTNGANSGVRFNFLSHFDLSDPFSFFASVDGICRTNPAIHVPFEENFLSKTSKSIIAGPSQPDREPGNVRGHDFTGGSGVCLRHHSG